MLIKLNPVFFKNSSVFILKGYNTMVVCLIRNIITYHPFMTWTN